MTRGSLVVINAIMSVIFLKSKLYAHHYISIFIKTMSIVIVGYIGILNYKKLN